MVTEPSFDGVPPTTISESPITTYLMIEPSPEVSSNSSIDGTEASHPSVPPNALTATPSGSPPTISGLSHMNRISSRTGHPENAPSPMVFTNSGTTTIHAEGRSRAPARMSLTSYPSKDDAMCTTSESDAADSIQALYVL